MGGLTSPMPHRAVPPDPELTARLSALWEKFRDTIFGRVHTVEEASRAASGGHLDDDLRRRAASAAHKLAGSLGGFGLAEGSRISREIEEVLEDPAPVGGAKAVRLAGLVRALNGALDFPPAR